MKPLARLALLFPALALPASAQTAVTVIPEPSPGVSWFGRAVGFVDLGEHSLVVVGAPLDDHGGFEAGRVYLVRALGGGVEQTLDGTAGQSFGSAVATLGDTTGDGRPELALGAPGSTADAVLVFSVGSAAPLLTVTGLGGSHQVVDALGDVNGDGAADFLAGSIDLGGVRVVDGATGAVLHASTGLTLFLSAAALGDVDGDGVSDYAVASTPTGAEVEVRSGTDGALIARLGPAELQPTAFDGFGTSLGGTFVAGAGDADADGVLDLAVGLPGDNTGGINAGRVSIYSGADGSELQQVLGTQPGEGFGWLLAEGGDIDQDGSDDLLEAPQGLPSALQGISGKTGGSLFSFAPLTAGGTAVFFGPSAALAAAGDVTGDGRQEFVIGDASLRLAHLFSPVDLALDSDQEFLQSFTTQSLELDAGPAHANELYFLVGSASGVLPGIALGSVVLPLNPDAYLTHTATHPGGPPLSSSFGTLDAAGRASAQLGYAPALKGLSLHHAFLTFAPSGAITFASNALPVIVL